MKCLRFLALAVVAASTVLSAVPAHAAVNSPNSSLGLYGYNCPSGGTVALTGTRTFLESTTAGQMYTQGSGGSYGNGMASGDIVYSTTPTSHPVPTFASRWWPIPSSAETHLNTAFANYSIPAPSGVAADPTKWCLKTEIIGSNNGSNWWGGGGSTGGFNSLTRFNAACNGLTCFGDGGGAGGFNFGIFGGSISWQYGLQQYYLKYTWYQYSGTIPAGVGAASYPSRNVSYVDSYYGPVADGEADIMTFANPTGVILPQCSDTIDNDADGLIDFGSDPGCSSAADTTEADTPQCADLLDNDGDSQVDAADSGCSNNADNTEAAGNEPAAHLSANPSTIASGLSSTLTWSSENATSCQGSGFQTNGAPSGSVSTGTLTGTTNYSVSCGGAVANTAVTVSHPTGSLTATPDRVNAGGTVTLSWQTDEAVACTVTGTNGFSSLALNNAGISSGVITTKTTFTLSCDSGGLTKTAVVNVIPRFEEF